MNDVMVINKRGVDPAWKLYWEDVGHDVFFFSQIENHNAEC